MEKQRFWEFLAHTSIIVGMMLVIFFVIDRFNPAMEFLSSSISKWLILAFSICSILNGLFSAVFLFQKQKRHEEKRGNTLYRTAQEQIHPEEHRFTQQQYNSRDSMQRQKPLQGYGYAAGYQTQLQYPAERSRYR